MTRSQREKMKIIALKSITPPVLLVCMPTYADMKITLIKPPVFPGSILTGIMMHWRTHVWSGV